MNVNVALRLQWFLKQFIIIYLNWVTGIVVHCTGIKFLLNGSVFTF